MEEINLIKKRIKDYLLEASMSTDVNSITQDFMIFGNGLLDSMGLLFLIEF